jgi:hypothetical protein
MDVLVVVEQEQDALLLFGKSDVSRPTKLVIGLGCRSRAQSSLPKGVPGRRSGTWGWLVGWPERAKKKVWNLS